MDEAAPLSSAPDAAPLALPAPGAEVSAALVPHSAHAVAALARSRYEAPELPAVLPRADAQLFRPLLAATAPGAAAAVMAGSPDGARTQPPRGARAARRPPRCVRATAATEGSVQPRKRRAALTCAFCVKRRAQPPGKPAGDHFAGAARAGRAPDSPAGATQLVRTRARPGRLTPRATAAAQEGIDDLNSRLRPPERLPTLPVQELVQRAPAPTAAPAAQPEAAAAPAVRTPSLVEIATEVALLNALSEVLAQHHATAQQRATAAANRLQRAEAHIAALGAASAAPPQLGAPEEVLALEYAPAAGDGAAADAGVLVPAGSSPPAAASSAVLDGATTMLRRYRDARAEARGAAARDAAITQRSREVLALTAHPDDDEPAPRPPSPGADALLRPVSPRDHTPASSGALVVHQAAPSGRGLDVAAAAARAASGDALRNLLDFALSDADFGRVLALLAAAGGHSGPAPASPDAIRAVPDLPGGAEASELETRECPVCLAELAGSGAVKAMPCGSARVPHAFHAACIERWLGLHNSCPTCRTALAEPPRGATAPDAAL